MPFTFTMPKLSPTMTEGTIARWLKKEGEFVQAGEVLLEIATDKATVEHQALDEGWLRKILIKEGGSAIINQAIAIFTEKKDESIEGYVPKGVAVEQATKETPAQKATKTAAAPAQEAPALPLPGLTQPAFTPPPPLETIAWEEAEADVPVTPYAKYLAKEKGLDLKTVPGSGPGGRISSRDLSKAQPESLLTFGHKEKKPTIPAGTFEETPLSPVRKIVAKRLQESKTFIPHFYVKQEIDASSLVDLREQLKEHGHSVTYNDILIRSCALALRQHPEVNAGFNSVNQTIVHFKTIDISVAVSLEEGLITPIIRHADFKNLPQISREIRELADRARKGKLSPQEYQGGSFCISNLGMTGISEFIAVINPPQAAILAVGAIEDKPVVKEGAVAPGKVLALNLSADHRVLDGAAAAKFMKTLQKILENPVVVIS